MTVPSISDDGDFIDVEGRPLITPTMEDGLSLRREAKIGARVDVD
eukprot:gene15798-21922_t